MPLKVTTELSMLSVLVLVKSPPPDKPVPALILTVLWSICSLATKPDKLSCTISESVVDSVSPV